MRKKGPHTNSDSGTTGQPKGACISHANVRSAVHHQGKKLGFHSKSRVLDFAPYSFDVAWSNFLHTLCAGGCICIANETDMLNDLSAAITSFKATLINVTPTVLRTINPIPSTLETVLLSGEMPYRDNITRWADKVKLPFCSGRIARHFRDWRYGLVLAWACLANN